MQKICYKRQPMLRSFVILVYTHIDIDGAGKAIQPSRATEGPRIEIALGEP